MEELCNEGGERSSRAAMRILLRKARAGPGVDSVRFLCNFFWTRSGRLEGNWMTGHSRARVDLGRQQGEWKGG